MKPVLAALLLLAFPAAAPAEIERAITAPPELADFGWFFERVRFSFPGPVVAQIRTEQAVPGKEVEVEKFDPLPASTVFLLSCVVTDDSVLSVSATTDLEKRAGAKSCLFDRESNYAESKVKFLPATNATPLDADIPVYEIAVASTDEKPACTYRIIARFTEAAPQREKQK